MEAPEKREGQFICKSVHEGKECGATFFSRRSLLAHQRFANLPGHGTRHFLRLIQMDNKCLVCDTVFRTPLEASLHLERSWLSARCLKDNVAQKYEYIEPSKFQCPLCYDEDDGDDALVFTDIPVIFCGLSQFRAHLKGHLPHSPKGGPVQVVCKRPISRQSRRRAASRRAGIPPPPGLSRNERGHGHNHARSLEAPRVYSAVANWWSIVQERREGRQHRKQHPRAQNCGNGRTGSQTLQSNRNPDAGGGAAEATRRRRR